MLSHLSKCNRRMGVHQGQWVFTLVPSRGIFFLQETARDDNSEKEHNDGDEVDGEVEMSDHLYVGKGTKVSLINKKNKR